MTADSTRLSHDEAVELLEDHVDGRLDPTTAAQVEAHVAACDECTRILGPVASVDLTAIPSPGIDEHSMRRSVRRTLLGVAARAAGILTIVIVLAVLASLVLVQPLLLGGERTTALARATYELPALIHPGATPGDYSIESGAQTRTFATTLQLPVGSATVDLGTVSSERRLVGSDTPLWPFVDSDGPNPAPARDVLDRLGRTSVATVAVALPDGLSTQDAQALAERLSPDVSTVWAAFDIAGLTDRVAATDPLATLGASTCGVARPPAELFAATSASAGSSLGAAPTSIDDALALVRDAVANTAEHPELAPLLPAGWHDALTAADDALRTSDPVVTLLVLTGPSDDLLTALDTTEATDGYVLATATYNWVGPVCG